jgi:hypothetical protein
MNLAARLNKHFIIYGRRSEGQMRNSGAHRRGGEGQFTEIVIDILKCGRRQGTKIEKQFLTDGTRHGAEIEIGFSKGGTGQRKEIYIVFLREAPQAKH